MTKEHRPGTRSRWLSSSCVLLEKHFRLTLLSTVVLLAAIVPSLPASAMSAESGWWCDVVLYSRIVDGVVVSQWLAYENCAFVSGQDPSVGGGGGIDVATGAFKGCVAKSCTNPCELTLCSSACKSASSCETCCGTQYTRKVKNCGSTNVCFETNHPELDACNAHCAADLN